MPQIVQARLPASIRRVDDADMLAESDERCAQVVIRERAAGPGREQERAVATGPGQVQAGLSVGPERCGQGSSDRHEPGLGKLRVPDGQDTPRKVRVAETQPQALARSQAGGVEQQQERAECLWP